MQILWSGILGDLPSMAFRLILCFHKVREAKRESSAFGLVTENRSIVHSADGVPIGVEVT